MATFNRYEKQEFGRQSKTLSDSKIRIMGNLIRGDDKFLVLKNDDYGLELSKSEAESLKDQLIQAFT